MINSMWAQWLLYIDVFLLGVFISAAVLHWWHRLRNSGDARNGVLSEAEKQQLVQAAQNQFKANLTAAADRLDHDLKAASDRISLHLEELGNQTADLENKRYREQLDILFAQSEQNVAGVRKALEDYVKQYQAQVAQLYADAQQNVAGINGAVADYANQNKDKLNLLLAQSQKTLEDSNQDVVAYRQSIKTRLDGLDEMAQQQVVGVSQEVATYKEELKTQLAAHFEREKQLLVEQMDERLITAITGFLNEALQYEIDLGAQSKYLIALLEQNKAALVGEVTGEHNPTK